MYAVTVSIKLLSTYCRGLPPQQAYFAEHRSTNESPVSELVEESIGYYMYGVVLFDSFRNDVNKKKNQLVAGEKNDLLDSSFSSPWSCGRVPSIQRGADCPGFMTLRFR